MPGIINWITGNTRSNKKNQTKKPKRQSMTRAGVQPLEDRRMLAFSANLTGSTLDIDVSNAEDLHISTTGADIVITGYNQAKQVIAGGVGSVLEIDIDGDNGPAFQTIRFQSAFAGLSKGVEIDGVDNVILNAALDTTPNGDISINADGYFQSSAAASIVADKLTADFGNFATISAPITATKIDFTAARFTVMPGADITTTTGDLSLTATKSLINVMSSLSAGGNGDIVLDSQPDTNGNILVRDVTTAGGDFIAVGGYLTANGSGPISVGTGDIDFDGLTKNVNIMKGIQAKNFSAQDVGTINFAMGATVDITNDITISTNAGGISISTDLKTDGGDISLESPDTQQIRVRSIETNGGDLTIAGASFTNMTGDSILTGNGDVVFDDAAQVSINGPVVTKSFTATVARQFVTSSAGAFSIEATNGDISITTGMHQRIYGTLTASKNIELTSTAPYAVLARDLDAGDDIIIAGGTYTHGYQNSIKAGGTLDFDGIVGNVNIYGGVEAKGLSAVGVAGFNYGAFSPLTIGNLGIHVATDTVGMQFSQDIISDGDVLLSTPDNQMMFIRSITTSNDDVCLNGGMLFGFAGNKIQTNGGDVELSFAVSAQLGDDVITDGGDICVTTPMFNAGTADLQSDGGAITLNVNKGNIKSIDSGDGTLNVTFTPTKANNSELDVTPPGLVVLEGDVVFNLDSILAVDPMNVDLADAAPFSTFNVIEAQNGAIIDNGLEILTVGFDKAGDDATFTINKIAESNNRDILQIIGEPEVAFVKDITAEGPGDYKLVREDQGTPDETDDDILLFRNCQLIARRPVDFVGKVDVMGAKGNADSFTIDFSEGNPIVNGNVYFDGLSGNDQVFLENGNPSRTNYNYEDATTGNIEVQNVDPEFGADDGKFFYSNTDQITDSNVSGKLFFFLPETDDVATLKNVNVAVNNGVKDILGVGTENGSELYGASFVDTKFRHPSSEITVRGEGGDDLIEIGSGTKTYSLPGVDLRILSPGDDVVQVTDFESNGGLFKLDVDNFTVEDDKVFNLGTMGAAQFLIAEKLTAEGTDDTRVFFARNFDIDGDADGADINFKTADLTAAKANIDIMSNGGTINLGDLTTLDKTSFVFLDSAAGTIQVGDVTTNNGDVTTRGSKLTLRFDAVIDAEGGIVDLEHGSIANNGTSGKVSHVADTFTAKTTAGDMDFGMTGIKTANGLDLDSTGFIKAGKLVNTDSGDIDIDAGTTLEVKDVTNNGGDVLLTAKSNITTDKITLTNPGSEVVLESDADVKVAGIETADGDLTVQGTLFGTQNFIVGKDGVIDTGTGNWSIKVANLFEIEAGGKPDRQHFGGEVKVSAKTINVTDSDINATADILLNSIESTNVRDLNVVPEFLISEDFDQAGQIGVGKFGVESNVQIDSLLPGWSATVNNATRTDMTIAVDDKGGFANGPYLYSGDGTDFGFATYDTANNAVENIKYEFEAKTNLDQLIVGFDYEFAWSRFDMSNFREAGFKGLAYSVNGAPAVAVPGTDILVNNSQLDATEDLRWLNDAELAANGLEQRNVVVQLAGVTLAPGDKLELTWDTVFGGAKNLAQGLDNFFIAGSFGPVGGNISVQAGGDVNVRDANTQTGDVDIEGGQNVIFNDISTIGGKVEVTSVSSTVTGGKVTTTGGEVIVDAENELVIGDIDTAAATGGSITLDSTFNSVDAGNLSTDDGNVSVTAQSTITVLDVFTSSGTIALTAPGKITHGILDSSGSGGEIMVVSNFNQVIGTAGSYVKSGGEDITISALGGVTEGNVLGADPDDILVNGDVDISSSGDVTVGTVTADDRISIESNGGSVTTGTLLTDEAGNDSGDIIVTAVADLTTLDVSTSFGQVSLDANGLLSAGNITSVGGQVVVDAGGNLIVGDIDTSAGTGGPITVTSVSGSVEAGNLSSDDGDVFVLSDGDINVGNVTSGSFTSLGSNFGAVTAMDINSGGSVSLSGIGDITVGDVDTTITPFGSIDLSSLAAKVKAGDLSTKNANVTVLADGEVFVGNIETGDGTSSGGNVSVSSVTDTTTGNVTSDGGTINLLAAGTLSHGTLDSSGSGGSIFLEADKIDSAGSSIITGGETLFLFAGSSVKVGDIDATDPDGILSSDVIIIGAGTVETGNITADFDINLSGPTITSGNIESKNGLVDVAGSGIMTGNVTANFDVTLSGVSTIAAGNVESKLGDVIVSTSGSVTLGDVQSAIQTDIDVTGAGPVQVGDVTGGSLIVNTLGSLTANKIDVSTYQLAAATYSITTDLIGSAPGSSIEFTLDRDALPAGPLATIGGDWTDPNSVDIIVNASGSATGAYPAVQANSINLGGVNFDPAEVDDVFTDPDELFLEWV